MNCRNCGEMCGAVEFFDPPYCCISCESDFKEKLQAKMEKYNQEVAQGLRSK